MPEDSAPGRLHVDRQVRRILRLTLDARMDLWKALYSNSVSDTQTARECDFVQTFLPLEQYPTMLDLACGAGRHSLELARRGYITTGADINARAIDVARVQAQERGLDAWFVVADLEDLERFEGTFDGIILFWQTFGFFSGESRVSLFRDLKRLMRPKGRLILDLFNRLHFTHSKQEEPYTERPIDVYSPFFEAEHLRTMLSYEDELRFRDRRMSFLSDPNLPAPGEIAGLTSNYQLRMIAACSDYDPGIVATYERPRMQLVFERA